MSSIFPKWMNVLPTVAAIGTVGGVAAVSAGYWYWMSPNFFKVGYMPTQPGMGFNHQLHAGKLGLDCRYCHTKVEQSYEANIPNVATCYGCHAENRLKNWDNAGKFGWIREAYNGDASIEWRRVHKLPDYVHNFPHHVHVKAGVSCYSCHGQITAMPVVYQAHSLAMGWCLDCHRNPERHLVAPDKVTALIDVEQMLLDRSRGDAKQKAEAARLVEALQKNPPQGCGACHY